MGLEFRVNAYQENWQDEPQVVSLRDGGFVVMWSSYLNNYDDGPTATYVAAQFYDADGVRVGQERVIRGVDGWSTGSVHMAQLEDGNLVVTWIEDDYDDILTLDTRIMAQILTSTGAEVGEAFRVDTVTSNNAVAPQVVALGDGGFIISFGADTPTNLFDEVYYRAYSADGRPVGADRVLNVNSNDFDEVVTRSASLSDGGGIVVWNSEAAVNDGTNDGQNQLRATLFGADGAVLRADFALQTHLGGAGTSRNYGYDVAATPGGGFALVNLDWSDDLDDPRGGRSYYFSLQDDTGRAIGARKLIHITDELVGDMQIARLTSGLFVVTWNQSSPGEIGDDVYAKVLSASGTLLSGAFEVGVDFDIYDEQAAATVAALAGGGFVITYTSDSIDNDHEGVAGRIFGQGTAANDTDTLLWAGRYDAGAGNDFVTGTTGRDEILGRDGADVLRGLAGADTMHGGAGADRLEGGADNDLYYVDDAGDRVIEAAGAGADIVRTTVSFDATGQHIERIEIIGSARVNLVGNTLNNALVGNAQNNALNGGQGADRMAAGLGDDLYYVDNAGDVVIEKLGQGADLVRASITYTLGADVERLQLVGSQQINAVGNALGNVLQGSDRANVIIGLGGRDLMTGAGGADRFDFRAISDSPWATYDRITDLEDEDVISLTLIDADTTRAGDQAFVLIDSFTRKAGQVTLAYDASADFTVLAADVNGDGRGDFRMVLEGDHRDYDNFRL